MRWWEGGRAREGLAILLREWLLRCEVEWMQMSSRLVWVRVKIEQVSWVFISAYGPGTEIGVMRRKKSSGVR